MRTIYAIQLQIVPRDAESPAACFDNLVSMIGRWVEGKYQRAWKTAVSMPLDGSSVAPIEGHALRGTSRSADGADMFFLEWTHPADGDSSTAWITNCIVANHCGVVQIAILLRISTTRVVLRPVRFDLGRPRLVDDVLTQYRTLIDGWPVPADAEHITSRQVHSFVEDVLLNQRRNLPVIALSPDAWHGNYSVDPTALFQRVKGFAHVAVLADKWAAFKLTDEVENPLSCFNGAVRVYWPGFNLHDDRFQHKLFLPQSIRFHNDQGLPLPDHLFRTLTAIASFRYTEGATIRDARKAIADLEKRKVEELRHQVKAGSVEKESLEMQLLEALERIDGLTAERDQYKADLAAQQAAWAEVQQAMAAGDSAVAEPQAQQEARFNTVADAVEQAKKDFSGPLVFLDSATASAKDSPYKDPERVYELFEALYLVASDWKEKNGALGHSWSEALSELGFDLRDQVSMTSKGKYGDDYKFMYRGQRRLFEKHITIGAKQPDKCLSVHWYRDDDDLVLAIGYCGRHLSNTTT
jgi:hypothetical protein